MTPTAHTGPRISPFYLEKLTPKKKKTSKDKRESKTKKTKREIGREFYKLTHEAKKLTPHIWLEGEGWGVDSVE